MKGSNEIVKAEESKKGFWTNLPTASRSLFLDFKENSIRSLGFNWCGLLDCGPLPDTYRLDASNLNIGRTAAERKEWTELDNTSEAKKIK